ncbi:MAG TPA: nuclear transport factor 2 family protein [Chloroflexota bacterium]
MVIAAVLMRSAALAAEGDTDLDRVIEHYHRALGEFVKGKPQQGLALFSQKEDVTLGNPFGPFARGPKQVTDTATRAAKNYKEGDAAGFDRISTYATPNLAYIVEVEHFNAKMVGRDDFAPLALRCTTVFRREEGTWKIVHRHADPITKPRMAESVIAK